MSFGINLVGVCFYYEIHEKSYCHHQQITVRKSVRHVVNNRMLCKLNHCFPNFELKHMFTFTQSSNHKTIMSKQRIKNRNSHIIRQRPPMGYISKWNQYVKNMYFHVHHCTIHNNTITETSLMFIKWCMDRENVAQIHNGVLFSRKMEPWVCNNVEGHQNHYINWNSLSGGRLVSHDFNHIWKFKRGS